MQDGYVRKLVSAALFAALVCVATIVFVVPLPGNGFANLGDCVAITAGCLLGPLWGGLAAAVGASLADLFLGYALYAPATFVIKGLMAVLAFFMLRGFRASSTPSVLRTALAAAAAECLMVTGYFIFEYFLLGSAAAIADIVGNSIQAVAGTAGGTALLKTLMGSKTLRAMLR